MTSQAKRVAVANPNREDLRIERELTDHAQHKAKMALRQKKEVEAQLKAAQSEIQSLQQKVDIVSPPFCLSTTNLLRLKAGSKCDNSGTESGRRFKKNCTISSIIIWKNRIASIASRW
jgi:hypothetical protein